MEQETLPQNKGTAQTAEAEKAKGASEPFSIGKFTSVEALYHAYERLQAEFTRRSQRLKALEEGLAEQNTKYTSKNASVENSASGANDSVANGDATRETSKIQEPKKDTENKPDGVFQSFSDNYGDYLDELINSRSPTNFCKGSAVYTPPFKPKTLAEAGKLARELIKFKGEF